MTFHQDIGFQPAPPSGIAAMSPGQVMDFANNLRNYQAQNALSSIYQQSIDPTTGAFNQARFNQLVAANPQAAWRAGEAMQQSGQAQEAMGRGTVAQTDAYRGQLTTMSGLLSGVDMSKPITPSQLDSQYLQPALKSGAIQPQFYNQTRQSLAAMGPDEDTRPLINAYKYAIQNAGTQAGYTIGPTVDQQRQIQQWLAQPYTWTDQNGQPKQGTYGQFLQERGIPAPSFFPQGTTGGTTAAAPGAGGGVSSVTTGRGAVTSGGAAAPPTRTAGGVGANVPVGTPAEVLPAPIVAGGQAAYQQDQALKASLGNRIAPLENVLSTLHANPDLQTAGVAGLNELEQVGRSFGMPQGTITSAGDAYQELGKYLAQYAKQLPGAERSDLAQLQAQAASPHLDQGRQAIAVLAAKAIGYERMRTAPVDQFNSQYPDIATAARNSGRYQLETADWAKRQDPVAYAIDEMEPEMVAKYVQGLSPTARARFIASAADAHRLYGIDVGTSVGPSTSYPLTVVPPAATTAPPQTRTQLPSSYPPGYTGG